MFTIQGIAKFTEKDMSIGEEMEKTLINEGFGVKKHYALRSPAELILEFGVESRGDHRPDTLFDFG